MNQDNNDKENIILVETEKLKIIPDKEEGEFNCTYSFNGEDHTLGNTLRWMCMKDQKTLFCGYSVPHPSEDLMNVRIQTKDESTNKVINRAMDRIIEISDMLKNKFQIALDNFDKNNN